MVKVELGHHTELKCIAPQGMPPPRVYWLRGGQMLQSDSSVLVTTEGHLLIGEARTQDTGNYTCVAENIAAKRLAPTSQIIVYGKFLFIRRKYTIKMRSVFGSIVSQLVRNKLI